MNLVAIPAFADNYVWMLEDGADAVLVDPGDPGPVVAALEQRNLRLVGILVTHHHADHVGALGVLSARLQGPVYGPARERLPVPARPLRGGDRFHLLDLPFEVIDVPGHTAGHIAYAVRPAGEDPLLFCGDTLFSAGCGRLFEGTPAQMWDSLQRLIELPGATRVCCAHEYTLSNLRFARSVEPDNLELARHEALCQDQRARQQPTLPSTLARERGINPFLRCTEPAVIAAGRAHGAASASAVDVFAALRQWKNEFR